MSEHITQVRFRKPRSSDRIGLIAVAILILALAWIGITPAIMPGRE
ncbi:MAG: hypothetical protein WDZ83_14565 [Rhizobiaceae bacterium]